MIGKNTDLKLKCGVKKLEENMKEYYQLLITIDYAKKNENLIKILGTRHENFPVFKDCIWYIWTRIFI